MKVQIEDERKFLIKKLPRKYLNIPGKDITQWYLWLHPPIRVRIENLEDCYLMVKIKIRPGVNWEFMKTISGGFADWLTRFRKFDKIRKTRRNIGNLELDRFYTQLWGLILLEFEKKPGSGTLEIPSDIVFEEVTGDERFSNHNLIKLSDIPEEWRCNIID